MMAEGSGYIVYEQFTNRLILPKHPVDKREIYDTCYYHGLLNFLSPLLIDSPSLLHPISNVGQSAFQ